MKDIPGYEGRYAADKSGNIYSLSYRHTNKVVKLRPNLPRNGYYLVCLRSKWLTVHSIIMLTFKGVRPNGYSINHINSNKTDNRFTNLEYVTPSENTKHSYRVGTQSQKGVKNNRSKLTDKQVISIRKEYIFNQGHLLAAKYNVSKGLINQIVNNKVWQHLL